MNRRVVFEGWNPQSVQHLLGRLADALGAQRVRLARIRERLASIPEQGSAGVLALEPALGRDARPIALGVRHREILGGDGGRRETSVFCPVERESVDVEWCRACPLARRISPDTVECTPVSAPDHDGPCARLGVDACVGEVMGTRQLSALPEVPANELAHALSATPGAPVVVVDDRDRLLGVIEPFAAASAPRGAPACALSHDQSSISEAASLADAVDLMVKGHARHLPVVRSDGRVVGVLADLDALRWVARRRRLSQ